MNTYQLKCFLTLAATLNYARASEQLNTSQPAVSRQIQSLENELGIRLFYRSTRHVELTDAGSDFLADAACIMDVSDRAMRKFSDSRTKEELNLAIGCPGISIMNLLVPALRKMKQVYPAFQPKLVNKPLSVMLPRLKDETLDIALGARLNPENDSELAADCVYRELLRTRMISVYSSQSIQQSHPAKISDVEQEDEIMAKTKTKACFDAETKALPKTVTTEFIRKQTLILYEPVDIPACDLKYRSSITDGRTAADTYFCSSPEEAIVLAASGFGIAILPEIFMRGVPHDTAAFRNVYGHDTGQNISEAYIETAVIADIPDVSFGIYCKTGNSKAVIKAFASEVQDSFIRA